MVNPDSLRNLFDNKIFGDFGLDATWKTKDSVTNRRGEIDSNSYSSGTTITIVPYDTFSSRYSFEEFGQLESGDTKAAVRYDKDIQEDDRLIFDGKTYEVSEIEDNFLQKNLIKIVSMERVA